MIKAAIILGLLATPAVSDPDRVSILLGSRHIGASGFQEVNPGVFVTWEGRVDTTVGVYHNSYGRTSVAVTAAVRVHEWQGGALSLFAGAAHYPGDGRNFRVSVGDVVPLVGVQIQYGNTFAQIIPMDGKPVNAVVSFGVTFELGK